MTIALSLLGCIESGLHAPAEAPALPGALEAPAALHFGELAPGQSAAQRLVVQNRGGSTLEVQPWVEGSGFELQQTDPFLLPAGEELELELELTASTWEHRGLLHLDTEQDALLVELEGVGLVPGLSLTPDPLDFLVVPPGVEAVRTLTLENVGAAALEVHQVLLDEGPFTLLEAPEIPWELQPQEQLELDVRLFSEEPDAYSSRLWLDTNAGPASTALDAVVEGPGLTGLICDPSGEGVVTGAAVTIWLDRDGDGLVEDGVTDRTDGEGRFQLLHLVPGTWVVSVEKGSFHDQFVAEVPEGGLAELPEPQCLEASSVELAVVQGSYDSIEVLLAGLGLEPQVFAGEDRLPFLQDAERLAEFDVVFLNCGLPSSITSRKEELAPVLRQYVADGGKLYVSDHSFELVEAAWPQAIDFANDDAQPHQVRVGFEQELEASVADENLRMVLGEQATLHYDIDLWTVADRAGAGTAVLMSGNPDTLDGVYEGAPLALRFYAGGEVLFTTFHNASQMTSDMELALQEMVLDL